MLKLLQKHLKVKEQDFTSYKIFPQSEKRKNFQEDKEK